MPRLARVPALAFVCGAILVAASATAPLPVVRAATSSDEPATVVERAEHSITASDLRAALRFLASDLLEGRGTGHPGNERAALYLATMFERIGAQPVDGRAFRQPLPLVAPTLGDPNRLAAIDRPGGADVRTPFAIGSDFSPQLATASGEVTAGLAFIGYGIAAPEAGHDDYAGIDVRGRAVVAFMGRPPTNNGGRALEATHGDVTTKARAAAARGAVALLLVPTDRRRSIAGGRQAWLDASSPRTTRFLLEDTVLPVPVVTVSGAAAWKLVASPQAGASSLDALQRAADDARKAPGAAGRASPKPTSFLVPDRQVSLATTIARRPVAAHNVLAMVEGSDPALSHEVVVVGAHFDHDGVDDDGRIYNGADDGGSGTVGVLELAEAFARAATEGRRPRRTVVFGLWNAEEKGLLGSRHFVANVLPEGGVPVVKLNMDMIGRSEEIPDKPDDRFRGLAPTRAADNANVVHLLGYSRSPELAAIVAAENEGIGLTLRTEYDDHEQNLLRRSDHWPFLEKGIPVAFFTTGLHPDYHTPDDDVDRIDFEKMERIVRLVFRTAWRLAEAETLPRFVAPARPTDQ